MKADEIRQHRVSKPQYPYSDYENHLKTDIQSLAQTYNFSGRGICRSIPHISKKLNLDQVEKHEMMAEFNLVDTNELWFPKAYPGDEIIFVVYCEVVKEPREFGSKGKRNSDRRKGKSPKVKKAKCEFFLLQYEVVNAGLFHVDCELDGMPADFQISYDRYVLFCGQQALKYQRCRNTMWNSEVFDHFFKKKKFRWIFQRIKGNLGEGCSGKHLKPVSKMEYTEKINLNNFPKDFDCALWDRVLVTGTIESQGGSWSAHSVYVERVETDLNPNPAIAEIAEPKSVPHKPPPAVKSAPAILPFSNPFSGAHLEDLNPFTKSMKRPSVTNPFAQPAFNPTVVPLPTDSIGLEQKHAEGEQKRDPVQAATIGGEDDEELKETIQIVECVVCMEDIPTHAFIPCGHRCVCEDCSETLVKAGKCPICQAPTTTCIRIYV